MILTLLLYIPFVMLTLFSILTINSSFAQWTVPTLDTINNQEINFSTFESDDSNVKIDYPSDWVLNENSSSNIEFRPPTTTTTSESGGGGELVKMSVIPLSSKS